MEVSAGLRKAYFARSIAIISAAELKPPALCPLPQRQIQAELASILDSLGRSSAFAQQLKTPITSLKRLQDTNHRVYIAASDADEPNDALMGTGGGSLRVVGFLKVGRKTLFLNGELGELRETRPLCVLDFYVRDSVQRKGHGLRLFKAMLENEKVEPQDLAYDRPSPKLIAFLGKNFGLAVAARPPNNFVFFTPKPSNDDVSAAVVQPAPGRFSRLRGARSSSVAPSTASSMASLADLPSRTSSDADLSRSGMHRDAADSAAAPPLRREHGSSTTSLPSLGRNGHATMTTGSAGSESEPPASRRQPASLPLPPFAVGNAIVGAPPPSTLPIRKPVPGHSTTGGSSNAASRSLYGSVSRLTDAMANARISELPQVGILPHLAPPRGFGGK
ncbi:hypothetical protein H9P43_000772 [Blastocladiella emersonii ATCC 22665]|nr:hypothetical protein H9P43_000772 [Blastocladiella emersonii ATCC 22665]